jgi:hypothetical protein
MFPEFFLGWGSFDLAIRVPHNLPDFMSRAVKSGVK